jgi:hypothetical protein
MFHLVRNARCRKLRALWAQVRPGMALSDAEKIMGFSFSKDSENAAGRIVYSHHTDDYLPFYLVVERASGSIIRRHNIRVLDEA